MLQYYVNSSPRKLSKPIKQKEMSSQSHWNNHCAGSWKLFDSWTFQQRIGWPGRNQETPGYSKVRLITELTTAKSTITGVKAAYDHGQKGSHFKKELIKISDH